MQNQKGIKDQTQPVCKPGKRACLDKEIKYVKHGGNK